MSLFGALLTGLFAAQPQVAAPVAEAPAAAITAPQARVLVSDVPELARLKVEATESLCQLISHVDATAWEIEGLRAAPTPATLLGAMLQDIAPAAVAARRLNKPVRTVVGFYDRTRARKAWVVVSPTRAGVSLALA